MTNPTSNYGFVLPTATDLVTDLPADFEVALQGVDTRLKALQPGTTLGDLAYSSATANTNTRLGIGSTGNVLTVTGGVPVWAAPAGTGPTGWTLLNAGGTALTGATTITVSSLAAKEILVLVIGASSVNGGSNMTLRINADSAANYTHAGLSYLWNSTYATGNFEGVGGYSNGTSFELGRIGNNADALLFGSTFIDLADKTGWKSVNVSAGGTAGSGNGQVFKQYLGIYEASAAVTSISIISSSGNFDAGTVYVMGAN